MRSRRHRGSEVLQLDERTLARSLSASLGLEVRLAIACEPLAPPALSAGEAAAFRDVAGTPRSQSWLRGRAALRRLRSALREDPDTAALRLPHRTQSLTHGGGLSVAFGVGGDGAASVAGTGVDMELAAGPSSETARLFLTASERRWLSALPEAARPAQLLRLWTEKEALYKANPANRHTALVDYLLAHPERPAGTASVRGAPGAPLRYATVPFLGGCLTAAVLRR